MSFRAPSIGMVVHALHVPQQVKTAGIKQQEQQFKPRAPIVSCVGDVVLSLYSTMQRLCLHTLAFVDSLFQQRKPGHAPSVPVSHQEDDNRAPFTGPSKGPTLKTGRTSGSRVRHTVRVQLEGCASHLGPAPVGLPFASFQQ